MFDLSKKKGFIKLLLSKEAETVWLDPVACEMHE